MNGKTRILRRPRTYRKRAPVRKRTRNVKPTTKMVKGIVKKEMAKEIENKKNSITPPDRKSTE